MGWQLSAAANGVIAFCYLAIATLVALGLIRTKQLTKNPLALATAAIFYTCALHHGHHALHMLMAFGGDSPQQLATVRSVFGGMHSVAIDLLGAVVAVVYLGLRRNYKALLNTPQMFDDRVRMAAEQALRDLAFTDVLTGIPNRAAYQSLADDFADDERPAIVLFLDLDGFKGINDTYGHDVGDRVLRDVGQAIAQSLGDEEHVFRLGGDEMIVVGLGHDLVDARDLRMRVEAAVSRPIATRNGSITVSASCGLALGAAREIGAMLREADQDMYRIKAERWTHTVPSPRGPEPPVPLAGRVKRVGDVPE